MQSYLEKGKREFKTPMARGRSTKIISMTKWIRTSRLSLHNSLYRLRGSVDLAAVLVVTKVSLPPRTRRRR